MEAILLIHITRQFRFWAVLSLILLLGACNPGVFVDEIHLSASKLTLQGNGDTARIQVSSTDWMVARILPELVHTEWMHCEVYDEKGNLINPSATMASVYLEGLGMIRFEDEHLDFSIRRTTANQLEVVTGDNLRSADFNFQIELGTQYAILPIMVTLQASPRYLVERITYTVDPHSYSTVLEQRKSLFVNNGSTEDIFVGVRVFTDETHTLRFASNDTKAFNYLKGNDNRIVYPKRIVNDTLQISTDKIPFSGEPFGVPHSFGEVTRNVRIPPGTHEVGRFIEFEEFHANFTLYLREENGPKTRCVQGILHSKAPTGDFVVMRLTSYSDSYSEPTDPK